MTFTPPVLLTGNTKIAIGVCIGDTPAHPAGFNEVESKVRDALIKDKLNKLIDQKATQLVEKARADGGDLAAAAKSMGLEVKTSDAVDRAGAIEGLGSAGMLPDAFAKPVGSIIGPNGIAADTKVVAKVMEKVAADPSGLASQRLRRFATRSRAKRGGLAIPSLRKACVTPSPRKAKSRFTRT